MNLLTFYCVCFLSILTNEIHAEMILMIKKLSSHTREHLKTAWWINRTLAIEECDYPNSETVCVDYAVAASSGVIYCNLKLSEEVPINLSPNTTERLRNASGALNLYILSYGLQESHYITEIEFLAEHALSQDAQNRIKMDFFMQDFESRIKSNGVFSYSMNLTAAKERTVNTASWVAALDFIVKLESMLNYRILDVNRLKIQVTQFDPKTQAYITAYTVKPADFPFCDHLLQGYPFPRNSSRCTQHDAVLMDGVSHLPLSAIVPIDPNLTDDVNLRHFYLNEELGPKHAPCDQIVGYLPSPQVEVAPIHHGDVGFIVTARMRDYVINFGTADICIEMRRVVGPVLQCSPINTAAEINDPLMLAVMTDNSTNFRNPTQFLLYVLGKLNGKTHACRFSVHYPLYDRTIDELV